MDFDGHLMCSEGDPNPDCDAYRPGTTYKGWKDQAYYDRREQQRARDEQEAQVRYAKWQEEQKRETEKKKHDCSWNPFDKNNCVAQGVGAALDATAQCFGGPEHTCLKIGAELAVGFVVGAACEMATAGAGSIGCLVLAGAAAGAVGGALECKSGQAVGNCVAKGALTGAATGLLGGALGRLAAPVISKVGGAALQRIIGSSSRGAADAAGQGGNASLRIYMAEGRLAGAA